MEEKELNLVNVNVAGDDGGRRNDGRRGYDGSRGQHGSSRQQHG